jgi:hypothetical protein
LILIRNSSHRLNDPQDKGGEFKEGWGEGDPSQSREATGDPDLSMSHIGGSSYESGQSSHEGRGDASGGDANVNDEDDHLHHLMEEEDVDGDADNINSDDEENSEAAPILNS